MRNFKALYAAVLHEARVSLNSLTLNFPKKVRAARVGSCH